VVCRRAIETGCAASRHMNFQCEGFITWKAQCIFPYETTNRRLVPKEPVREGERTLERMLVPHPSGWGRVTLVAQSRAIVRPSPGPGEGPLSRRGAAWAAWTGPRSCCAAAGCPPLLPLPRSACPRSG
jgi:hypothetical protein